MCVRAYSLCAQIRIIIEFFFLHFISIKIPVCSHSNEKKTNSTSKKNVPHSNSNLQSKSEKKVTTSNLHKIRNIISRVGVSLLVFLGLLSRMYHIANCLHCFFFLYFFLCLFSSSFGRNHFCFRSSNYYFSIKLFQNFHSSHFFPIPSFRSFSL